MKNAKEVEMALYKTVQIIQMSTKQEQRCREREREIPVLLETEWWDTLARMTML